MRIALLLLAASFVAAQNDPTTTTTTETSVMPDFKQRKMAQATQMLTLMVNVSAVTEFIKGLPLEILNNLSLVPRLPGKIVALAKQAYDININKTTTYLADIPVFCLQDTNRDGNFAGISATANTNKRYPYNYVDYRDQGIVTPPKDQGQCGSCYSFAATGLFECKCMNRTNKDINTCLKSEQQIIDCSAKRYEGKTQNQGCSRGTTTAALQYMNEIDTLSSNVYKYQARQAWSCGVKEDVSKMSFYTTTVALENEDHLACLLNRFGPVVVYIYACSSFQMYKSDIYNDAWSCSSGALNHAVLIVGLQKVGNTEAWIVKNSWGEKWGEKGFLRIEKGKNICQMLKAPAIILTDKPNPDTAPPAPLA